MTDLSVASLQLILILSSSASFTCSTFVEDRSNSSYSENNLHGVGGGGGRGGVWVSTGVAPTKFGSNVCYVQQSDGCRFRIAVFPDECRGGPSGRETRNTGIGKRDLNEIDPSAAAAEEDAAKSLLRLEAFEQKLTKMMEDLSVRSLRHVREIRSDLRQMTLSMNRLKTGSDVTSAAAADGRGGGGPLHHQPPRQCPSQFIGMGNWKSCYRFSNFEATWNEAQEYCKIFGASLLSLDTMKESNIIDYFMKSNAEFQEPKGWWTGGSYISRSRRWTWTSSGQSIYQPINFARWASGQPPASMTTTHCIVLFRPAKYLWHAAPCSDRHNFICQLNSA